MKLHFIRVLKGRDWGSFLEPILISSAASCLLCSRLCSSSFFTSSFLFVMSLNVRVQHPSNSVRAMLLRRSWSLPSTTLPLLVLLLFCGSSCLSLLCVAAAPGGGGRQGQGAGGRGGVGALSWTSFARTLGIGDAAALADVVGNAPKKMVEQLADISDERHYDPRPRITRTFNSPAHREAAQIIAQWMREAGLAVTIDAMANVRGVTPRDRVSAEGRHKPRVVVGSHYDTVIDGGKYDGALGVIVGIQAVRALLMAPGELSRPVEVIAFSDEEGVRFPVTFLGSRAVAGTLTDSILSISDKNGTTLLDAIKPHTRADVLAAARDPEEIGTYVELHIEQGPVLEAANKGLGVVLAIAGQKRITVSLMGEQGHAGTVPMGEQRRDTLAAAADMIIATERICQPGWSKRGGHLGALKDNVSNEKEEMLVCTVGHIINMPNAKNTISGAVNMTVDVRARREEVRDAAAEDISAAVHEACSARRMEMCELVTSHEAPPVESAEAPTKRLRSAIAGFYGNYSSLPGTVKSVDDIPALISGAGHDALAMADIADVTMMFVRHPGGVSHSPLERVLDEDIVSATGAMALYLKDEVESGDDPTCGA